MCVKKLTFIVGSVRREQAFPEMAVPTSELEMTS
jgi:hypothetical protein